MKNKRFILFIIVILFITLMIGLIYFNSKKRANQEVLASAKVSAIFDEVEKSYYADVTKFIVYGTHFNLEGSAKIPDISGISITKSTLVIKNPDGEEQTLNATYEYKNGILSFSTIKEINAGIDLENLSSLQNYIFLKVTFSNSEVKYYSLKNSSEYTDVTYYTISKNNSNDKIDICFDTYNDTPFMQLKVTKNSPLPNDVYDIVLDAGHGGIDVGATNNGYNEADIVLGFCKSLKVKLESFGLKVFLTRDGSESPTENTAYTMYDENGRINLANKSNAKILLSFHMNSNSSKLSSGGIEVYAPSKCNLNLAKLFANNLVKTAKTNYSKLSTHKEAKGVYVHNFNQYDILAFKAKAKSGGYKPYNITTSTPYLYMIREVGGIATNAFVDGRNTVYGANKYYHSNVGIEAYLIELGYMIIEKDLNNVISNSNLYAQAISDSLNEFYNLTT